MRDLTERRAEAIARGIVAGWFQLGVSIVVGPIYTWLVLAFLPRSEAGFWMVLVSLVAYVNLFDIGLGPTVTRLTAFARGGKSDYGTVAEVYWTSRRLYLGLVAIVIAVGIVVTWLVLPNVAGARFTAPRLVAWCLFITGAAASIFAAHPFAVAAGSGMVSIYKLTRAMAQLVGTGLAALAGFGGFGLVGFAAAWAAQNAVLLIGTPLVRRVIPDVHPRTAYDRRLARAMINPSLQWAATNLGGALILASAPLIVASRVSVESVPSFIVTRQIAETLYIIALTPALVIEPFISAASAASDVASITDLLRLTIRRVTTLLAIGGVVGAVFGREIITAWVGVQNFPGYATLWLLLVLYVLEAHHVVHAIAVMATGRIAFFRIALGSGVVTVALGIALARVWGVLGVVIGMVVAQLLTNNWYVPRYSLRLFRIPLRAYLTWIAPAVAVAAAATAIALALRWMLLRTGSPSPVALMTTLLVLAVVLLPIVWVAGLTTAERGTAASALRRAMRASRIDR